MQDPRTIPTVNHLLVLDESASMQMIQKEAICSFNDTIRAIGQDAARFSQEHRLTLLTFNGRRIKQHFFNQPVDRVRMISPSDYFPNAGTPLMDCMGVGIGLIKSVINEDLSAHKVMITIVTDGAENGSKKYCKTSIRRLIGHLKKSGWIFNYIGANHDVRKICAELNIDNFYEFKRSGQDLRRQMLMERMARQSYYRSWSQSLQTNVQVAA